MMKKFRRSLEGVSTLPRCVLTPEDTFLAPFYQIQNSTSLHFHCSERIKSCRDAKNVNCNNGQRYISSSWAGSLMKHGHRKHLLFYSHGNTRLPPTGISKVLLIPSGLELVPYLWTKDNVSDVERCPPDRTFRTSLYVSKYE